VGHSGEKGYFLSEAELWSVHAINVMVQLARSSKRLGTRKSAYRNIGVYLRQLRESRDRIEWIEIVNRECGLSRTHAYRIMRFSGKNFAAKSMGANPKTQ
jgi:hypothetical protein